LTKDKSYMYFYKLYMYTPSYTIHAQLNGEK
jgi:hypothetical protein